MAFRLAAGAAQAKRGWYILDAFVKVVLSPAAPAAAHSEIDVLTDGRAAAEIEVALAALGSQRGVWWSAFDLWTGGKGGLVFGSVVRLHYRNYLQVLSVRPGVNSLGVAVWQFGGVVVHSATLLPGSGVEHGSLAPPKLQLEASLPVRNAEVGDVVPLHYQVASTGFPARNVGVVFGGSGPGVILVDVPTRLWPWVSQARGIERVQALAPGNYRLIVRARGETGGYGYISKTVALRILPRRGGRPRR